MSDRIEDLLQQYKENVLGERARSVGLFPIPEYPEFEVPHGMWSTAVDVILTTLRYLAPATLLTLFWGQESFLFKLVKYIDSAFRGLIYSNEEQKQSILQWLAEVGPLRVENLDVVWRHGWIVCGVLDAALPGACAGHPPTRLSLKHAQAIADHYLGVEPVFSRLELESNSSISRNQEWKLITYLDSIRVALSKLTPPTCKTTTKPTQKVSSEATHFTMNYVARGSGLTAAQVNNKVYFKIYPTAQQSLDPAEITILIHGPKETYGMSIIPPILGKSQMIRQNLLGLQSKFTYTENVLPITQGTTYLRTFGTNDMNKTFYIPKTKYDIEIEIDLKQDHVRVGYVANFEGKYEISITSRGQNVVGSPFTVTASNNIVSTLERDSFCLEDGEEIDIVDVKTDRKVVLRIVDFVTEKMILRENGTLEKISEEEAKYLLENDDVDSKGNNILNDSTLTRNNNAKRRFYGTVNKVITVNRFCKLLYDIRKKQNLNLKKNKTVVSPKNQDIPDIVNSTFNEDQIKSYQLPEKWDRIIIPENISVSLFTEKPKPFTKDMDTSDTLDDSLHSECLNNNNIFASDPFEDDNMSVDTMRSSNNPFLNDAYSQSYILEKRLGSFVANEYESNNSQNEETENANVKIFFKEQNTTQNQTTNPFLDIINIERPKTPVYRIIAGEITDHKNPVDINIEKEQSNEPICDVMNPFVDHEQDPLDTFQEKPDFIIGAPVSLPPLFNVTSPNSSSNINNINNKNDARQNGGHKGHSMDSSTKISTCLNKVPVLSTDTDVSSKSSNFYSSLDSNLTEDVRIISNCSPTPSNTSSQIQTSREMSPKKDTWDSAYVSIDENSSTGGNFESNNETLNKKLQLPKEFSQINSSDRDNWQTGPYLKEISNINDDSKTSDSEIKISEFMPIIEENERNIPSAIQHKNSELSITNDVTDPVTETFAELNDIYDDIFKTSEVSSVATTQESQNLEIDYTLERNDIHVDSASELRTDVKRQTKIIEGKISEVQANVTESVSASQSLHFKEMQQIEENNNENLQTQFGDQKYSNIVLEKKKYWDEKIRQIEEKSEEIKLLQCKRRLTSKHLRRNDSLSKRRGKKIVQNFLNKNKDECNLNSKLNDEQEATILQKYMGPRTIRDEEKLVNNDVETEYNEPTSCFGKKSSDSTDRSIMSAFKHIKVSTGVSIDMNADNNEPKSNLNFKQELSEKVFQAFETSPKRFFGTSRKHILNKIDTFLGLPDYEKETKKVNSDISHESGLVSSRISLFHNISQTEELPWSRRKSKSLYNIAYQEDSEKYNLPQNQSVGIKAKENSLNEDMINIKNSCNEIKSHLLNQSEDKDVILKEKRAKMIHSKFNKSFDETMYTPATYNYTEASNDYVKNTVKDLNKQTNSQIKSTPLNLKSISKSEMDIFNKVTTATSDEDFDKYKSYDELPKICVKNFISHYEDVSKISNTSPAQTTKKTKTGSPNYLQSRNSTREAASISTTSSNTTMSSSKATDNEEFMSINKRKQKLLRDKSLEILSNKAESTDKNSDFEVISNPDKDTNYFNLSDIELEIVESKTEKTNEFTAEKEPAHLEYKSRFTKARKYFQSLEELREERRTKKLNKSECVTNSQSTESLEEDRQPKKKSNIKKSRSMPSSEIAKIWNQMQEEDEAKYKKLVKISEKFNVDDLFEDVMEGRLSRQGSLRGIPHKKAVLETFRSMENVTDSKLNSYEMAVSQLNEFAEENRIKNAQTYLSEYPYLPTTDPSKYHSRLDVNASGLITFKELKKIPRRNSVPDLRLNPTFTADL